MGAPQSQPFEHKNRASQIERKIAQLMDRLFEADSESVIHAHEKRIGDLETDRMVIRELIEKCGTPLDRFAFDHLRILRL